MPINELYKNKSTLIAKAKQHRADSWQQETLGDYHKPGSPERKKAAHKANRSLKASNIASKMAGHKFAQEEETKQVYDQQVAIQELSRKVLSKYVVGAAHSARQASYGAGLGMAGASKSGPHRTNLDTAHKRFDKSEKRQKGIENAAKRLAKD